MANLFDNIRTFVDNVTDNVCAFFAGTNELEHELLPQAPTIPETLVAVEEGLSYLVGVLEAHGLNIQSVSDDLQKAITTLVLKNSTGGGHNEEILGQVQSAVKSAVTGLLADVSVPGNSEVAKADTPAASNTATGLSASVSQPTVFAGQMVTLNPNASGSTSSSTPPASGDSAKQV